MSAAGLANPSPAARSISREIERVDQDMWAVLKRHVARCQLCAGSPSRNLCTLGTQLREAWCAVLDLKSEPSRWTVVEVSP